MHINKTDLLRALSAPYDAPLTAELSAFTGADKNAYTATQLALLEARAADYLRTPVPPLPYSVFALYWQTGDRSAFQQPFFERRTRLLTFALLAWLKPEKAAYTDALAETLWAICAEPFWAVPAHFLDAEGNALPFDKYDTQPDLFACETGCAIAEALRIAGAQLPSMVVQQAEAQVYKRVLHPFMKGGEVYRFEGMKNNWSGVCGSAVGITALYMVQEPNTLANLLARCMESEEVYLRSFGADGVCTEGVDYWSYGFGFFTCFAEMLAVRTHGAFDYFAEEKVQAIARSQQAFYFSGRDTISFSDGGEHSRYRMGLTAFLHRRTGAAVPPAPLAADVLGDDCARFCLALRDFLWADTASAAQAADTCIWLQNAEWFLSRAGTLALAAKAGHNGESHNHNDCGSFILYKNGRAVVCDLGAGLYDAAYFGPERYNIFVNRSASHNVPLVNGAEQQEGGAYAAAQAAAHTAGQQRGLTMQLAGCYPAGSVQSFTRSFVHDTSSQCVRVTDAFAFYGSGSVTEVFCAREEIRLTDSTAVFTREGEQVTLQYNAALCSAAVHTQSYTDHLGQEQTAWLLHLTVTLAETVTAEFIFR